MGTYLLRLGAAHEEIRLDYEFLQPNYIRAALLYAARQTDYVILPASV